MIFFANIFGATNTEEYLVYFFMLNFGITFEHLRFDELR